MSDQADREEAISAAVMGSYYKGRREGHAAGFLAGRSTLTSTKWLLSLFLGVAIGFAMVPAMIVVFGNLGLVQCTGIMEPPQ